VSEDAADSMVVDLRGVDMMSLLADTARPAMKTALDRLLESNASGNNGFNNSIDLSQQASWQTGRTRGSPYCRWLPSWDGSQVE